MIQAVNEEEDRIPNQTGAQNTDKILGFAKATVETKVKYKL